jgi:hypothetical protein
VTVRIEESNVAVTFFAASIVSVQVPVPAQSPDQPVNTDVLFGVAVSVSIVPLAMLAAQMPELPAQLMIPAGVEVVVPPPAPVCETVSA